MMKKTMLSLLLLSVTGALFAGAPNPFRFEPFYRHDGAVSVATSETPQTGTVTFPAIPRKPGYGVCLYVRPYLQTATPNGWNNYLALRLNRKLMAQHTDDGFPRLLRRGEGMGNTFRDQWPWWRNNAWLIFFNDGKSELDKRITSPREEGYDYWFDISDAVNFVRVGADDRIEEALPNTLEITNLFTQKLGGKELQNSPLMLDGFAVGYVPEAQLEADRAAGAKLVERVAAPAVKRFQLNGAEVALTRGGDLAVNVNGEEYLLESAFSYPAKPEMKFNTFSAGTPSGNEMWKPAVAASGDAVSANGGDYKVERRIVPGDKCIRILDTVTNTSKQVIGLNVRYDMIQPRLISSKSFKLAGLNDYRRQEEVMANPSLFLNRAKSGLGMVADDDVLRLQLELANLGNLLRMETRHLGLKPGESYTLERTVCPIPTTAYFDFINLVRDEQKLNRTIEGPFIFEDGKIPDEADFAIVVAGPWFKYGWGAHISVPEYTKIMKKRIADLRAKRPNAKILPRMETDLITFDKRKIKNSDKLPKSSRLTGRYGHVLSPEETKILLDDPVASQYKDSMMFTSDGRLIVDTYYPPEPYIDLIVRPADNNFRTREMLSEIDFMLKEIGCDGVYLDQFEPQAPLGSFDSRCTYDRWDGRTVKLAADGTVAAKYYDYALAGIEDRRKILDHVLNQGKTVVGNSRSVCDATNRRGFRFSEMETDALDSFLLKRDKPLAGKRQTLGHLAGSPVILGVRPERFMSKGGPDLRAVALMRGIVTALRNGQLYYYYGHLMPLAGELGGSYGVVNHMYPFTPVELNEGFLIGKERIITAISRDFTFEAGEEPLVLLFDRFGREKAHDFTPVRGADGKWSIPVKLDDWNEIAIIDFTRKPVRWQKTAFDNLPASAWHGRTLKDAPDAGVLELDGPADHKTLRPIPVDPAKRYRLSGEFRALNGEVTKPFYFGLAPYDKDGRFITAASTNGIFALPQTELAAEAKVGDTTLLVKDAKNWKLDRNSYLVAFNAKADKSDLPNFDHSPYLKKVEPQDGNWLVTLSAPLKRAYPAGTALRLHLDGSTYIYAAASAGKLSGEWTKFSGNVQGIGDGLSTVHLRPGTAKLGIVFFCHQPDLKLQLRNITLEEAE